MADSITIRRFALPHVPEAGQDTYLQTTKAMGMWRSVSPHQYSAQRVQRLLTEAKAGAQRFYSHGLYALETTMRPNW